MYMAILQGIMVKYILLLIGYVVQKIEIPVDMFVVCLRYLGKTICIGLICYSVNYLSRATIILKILNGNTTMSNRHIYMF